MLLLLSLSTLNIDSRKELCPTDRFYLSLSLSSVPMGKFIGIEGARPPIAPSIDWVWEAAAAPEVSSSFRSLSLGGQSAAALPSPMMMPLFQLCLSSPLFSSLRFFVFGHGTRRRRRRLSFLPLLFFSLSCLRAPCRARAVGRLQQFPESEERNCGEKMKKVVKIKTASTGIESVSDLECFAVHNKGRIEFQVRDLWPGPLGPSSSVRRFGCGGIKAAACLHNGYRSKGPPPPHTRPASRARGGFL